MRLIPHATLALLIASFALAQSPLEPILSTAQGYLEQLEVLAVYEHRHGRRDEKYELRVMLGIGQAPFAYFILDPARLTPLPVGLEDFVRPPAAPLERERVWQAAWHYLDQLALSTLVVPRPRHFDIFLVHEGRMVGKMYLNADLTPRLRDSWLRDYARSPWRVP